MNWVRGAKKYLRYGCIVLLFVLLIAIGLLLLDYWEKQQGSFLLQDSDGNLNSTIRYDGKEYILKDNVQTVLVMGLDKFEESAENDAYNNDQQADFLMLFVLDNANSTCTALHINRDTMAKMNILGVAGESVGTVTKQIALAHTYGNGREVSCRNTLDAVSLLLLNARVDHYVSLTMDSVPVFNDLVGGVEVTVLDDFSGIDETLVRGERVTLLGEHALRYVRTRYGMNDSSNDSRMARQRQYLQGLHKSAKQRVVEDEDFVVEASVKMSDYIVSDCSALSLQSLLKKISSYELTEIQVLEGESVVGETYMEFYPEEDALTQTVIKLFYELKD